MIDGVSFENAIYETISALCTVGLTTGITSGLSLASCLILIIFMFFGRVGIMTISVGFMMANPAEDPHHLRADARDDRIGGPYEEKTYAVIGLGRFGTAVAERLYALGNEVLVIDDDAERVQRMESRVTYAVVADARDEAVLRSLGMRNYDCAIVAIGTDLAAASSSR